ncbi:response regulator transcription factor [Thermincola potens]|uniref:Stage 0 sporulation protein A homolog n=1 Tax=Thermincola potens (strain JR) TaxID=635013 RepID=D5XEY4_THEPJ|nr:response regulator transcription factor [Thermincola potens]ADG82205.1 two component transcriptional regulator, winged helix family [Thermincola potens JR]
MKQKILVVDDDSNICELLVVYLEEDFQVKTVFDGNNLEQVISEYRPDLILLDVMLPGKNGFDICREIRDKYEIPIIFLSAKGEEIDKVLGLEFGADDYITKPFSPREMVARVKAVLRRVQNRSGKKRDELIFPHLVIDLEARTVQVNNSYVDLTPKEFDILVLMARHNGKVFTREEILNRIWGYDFAGETRAVDSHIKRIRQKIEKIPGAPEYLHTVWGLGYRFEVPES